MAKSKLEMSQKLELIGTVDKTDDEKIIFIIEDDKEPIEIDAFEIFEKILGYNIKITADLPIEV